MKPPKTKAQIRAEIDAQIKAYLSTGGEVNSIPRGTSGNTENSNQFASSSSFEPKQERTPVNDVVKEIEERKKNKTPSNTKKRATPRRKLITDDFGEPIRWVWLDK
ncbi:MAG: hypothetical protein KTR17_06080 [Cellvibrionaceae bacterium]|nr:hypothetical protein [Cellvibrionaceae bacterium]